MRKGQGAIRIGTNALLLLTAAMVAHALAGGSFISAPRLSIEVTIILIGLGICGNAELTGPKLAILVLVVQSVTHIVLGGATMSNDAMGAAHLAAGTVSYIAINSFERFWAKFYDYLLGLISPVEYFNEPGDRSRGESTAPIRALNLFEFTDTFSLRGPPGNLSHA